MASQDAPAALASAAAGGTDPRVADDSGTLVEVETLPENSETVDRRRCLTVDSVARGGLAWCAGVRTGDLVVRINGGAAADPFASSSVEHGLRQDETFCWEFAKPWSADGRGGAVRLRTRCPCIGITFDSCAETALASLESDTFDFGGQCDACATLWRAGRWAALLRNTPAWASNIYPPCPLTLYNAIARLELGDPAALSGVVKYWEVERKWTTEYQALVRFYAAREVALRPGPLALRFARGLLEIRKDRHLEEVPAELYRAAWKLDRSQPRMRAEVAAYLKPWEIAEIPIPSGECPSYELPVVVASANLLQCAGQQNTISLAGAQRRGEFLLLVLLGSYRANGPYETRMKRWLKWASAYAGLGLQECHVITSCPKDRLDGKSLPANWLEAEAEAISRPGVAVLYDRAGSVLPAVCRSLDIEILGAPFCMLLRGRRVVDCTVGDRSLDDVSMFEALKCHAPVKDAAAARLDRFEILAARAATGSKVDKRKCLLVEAMAAGSVAWLAGVRAGWHLVRINGSEATAIGRAGVELRDLRQEDGTAIWEFAREQAATGHHALLSFRSWSPCIGISVAISVESACASLKRSFFSCLTRPEVQDLDVYWTLWKAGKWGLLKQETPPWSSSPARPLTLFNAAAQLELGSASAIAGVAKYWQVEDRWTADCRAMVRFYAARALCAPKPHPAACELAFSLLKEIGKECRSAMEAPAELFRAAWQLDSSKLRERAELVRHLEPAEMLELPVPSGECPDYELPVVAASAGLLRHAGGERAISSSGAQERGGGFLFLVLLGSDRANGLYSSVMQRWLKWVCAYSGLGLRECHVITSCAEDQLDGRALPAGWLESEAAAVSRPGVAVLHDRAGCVLPAVQRSLDVEISASPFCMLLQGRRVVDCTLGDRNFNDASIFEALKCHAPSSETPAEVMPTLLGPGLQLPLPGKSRRT